MSQKVLITSIGRTATRSLAHMLNQLPGVEAQHERGVDDPYFLFLSQHPAYKNYTKNYLKARDALAQQSDAEIYVEVNPYLRFADHSYLASLGWKTIFLVRHPKTYLESVYLRTLFTSNDMSFQTSPGSADPFYDNWSGSSRFEKLCWYYGHVHRYILEQDHPIFKYESLVEGNTGLSALLSTMGLKGIDMDLFQLPHMNRSASQKGKQRIKSAMGRSQFLGEKLKWDTLSQTDLKTYQHICVPLITKLGYELS